MSPPLFARNLPSNVSKSQDLNPRISELFAIPPLFLESPLPFSKFLDPPLCNDTESDAEDLFLPGSPCVASYDTQRDVEDPF